MNNFIISLNTAHERRKHISEIFSSNNINYSFFDAIKPNEIEKIALEIGIDLSNSNLKISETSCLLSHLYLWKKVIDDNLDYITIYEDDIHLGEKSNIFLTTYEWIPKDCEIIKLESFYKTIYIENKSTKKLSNGRNLVALKDKHLGCGGYIISKRSAIKLLEFVKNYNEVLPVDHYIFNFFLLKNDIKIYQMTPALCIQDHKLKSNSKKFSSYLSEDRKMRKGEGQYKIKLFLFSKAKKEIIRIIKKLKNFFIKKDKGSGVNLYFK